MRDVSPWAASFRIGHRYTPFEYSHQVVTPEKQAPQDDIHVSVDITNTGQRKDEVIQLPKGLCNGITTWDS
ncbi:hypothetical protein [Chitinophaga polysaccharea]|uniref:hypothetical protein n=1 Tax=Chitinophaga polysaccharea TaxID=1293035 RepID=UPI0011A1B470|nr:hypothetical protein [Chitinophaga polysaccharea]